jgi:hypothetical protein
MHYGRLLTVVIVLGCTVYVATRPATTASPSSLLAAAQTGGASHRALVVFQLEDCESNLAFLSALTRDGRLLMPLEGALVGSREDLTPATRALARNGYPIPAGMVDDALVRTVRMMGYERTPVLLILDGAGRIRYTASPPGDHGDQALLQATLAGFMAPAAR